MNQKLPTGPDFAALDTAHNAAKTYLESLDQRAVYPSQQAIAALNRFDEALPGQGTDPTAVVQLLDQLGRRRPRAQMGGRYFGFVNGGALPATLAVRQLSSVWDQNPALNVMSPIASTLEQVCERWLNELLICHAQRRWDWSRAPACHWPVGLLLRAMSYSVVKGGTLLAMDCLVPRPSV